MADAHPMESEDKQDTRFESIAAILLGVAAVASAWAGHQAGLWGGNCLTAYSEAGKVTTHAATLYQESGADAARDSALDIMAKQLIAEAAAIKDPDLRDTKLDIARYLYTQQLSDDAYKALKLPPAARSESEEAWNALPEEALLEALNIDLDDEYWHAQLDPADEIFLKAEKNFEEGRRANGIGDQFGFVSVLLTVSMFFLGISLVFKSKAKWALLGAGGVVLAASLAFMATLESAGTGLPSGSAAAASTDKAGDEKAEAKPEEAPAPAPAPAAAPPAAEPVAAPPADTAPPSDPSAVPANPPAATTGEAADTEE